MLQKRLDEVSEELRKTQTSYKSLLTDTEKTKEQQQSLTGETYLEYVYLTNVYFISRNQGSYGQKFCRQKAEYASGFLPLGSHQYVKCTLEKSWLLRGTAVAGRKPMEMSACTFLIDDNRNLALLGREGVTPLADQRALLLHNFGCRYTSDLPEEVQFMAFSKGLGWGCLVLRCQKYFRSAGGGLK